MAVGRKAAERMDAVDMDEPPAAAADNTAAAPTHDA